MEDRLVLGALSLSPDLDSHYVFCGHLTSSYSYIELHIWSRISASGRGSAIFQAQRKLMPL